MPLCPQITNTPITVTQTADFTVTSVVPAIADTKDGLAFTIEEVIDNSGNQIYRQLTPPTSPPFTLKIGDLWFDTDDGNKEYYWDGTNWISVQDGSIATKNRTYYAATAPSGSDLVTGDIWFDTTTGNKPYRWNGSSWISVQDASIATALATANAAQTTANGKNKVTYSLSAPSGSGTATGDIWFRYDGSGIIIGQWEWTGSAWSSKTIGSAVIANLDAGKITAGTISVAISLEAATITGGSININNGTFVVTNTGAVTITAGSFNINSGTFQVSNTGVMTATGATLNTSNANNKITIGSGNNALSFFYNGSATAHLLATTGGAGARLHYGATANGSSAVYPSLDLDSSGIAIEGSATYQIASTSLGNIIYGGHNSTGAITVPGSTISTGTFSSSSTDTTTGTYLSETGAMIARRNNQIPIFSHRYNASGTAELIRLAYNGADAGGIQTSSAGSPSFRTTSDYRLKNNIQDYTEAVDIIKGLRVRAYEMKNNPGKIEIGFIAHEYAEVVPDMVNGVKDAVDADGNPEYQSISTTNLIPYLVGALKEALLRIEQLEQGR